MFEQKNDISFEQYKKPLENWVDPPSKKIELTVLRKVIDTINIDFKDESDKMYPIKGARKKKFKEIIYPKKVTTMKDIQTDSSLFAPFAPPGIYDKHLQTKTKNPPYYAFLRDEEEKWLASHKIGIDGPIFYFSDTKRKELNLWLLLF